MVWISVTIQATERKFIIRCARDILTIEGFLKVLKMKKLSHKLIIVGSMATLAFSMSCKKFLEQTPTQSLNQIVLANKAGVDGLLIGAYALADGVYNGQAGCYLGYRYRQLDLR
jgi:hypothetical protein